VSSTPDDAESGTGATDLPAAVEVTEKLAVEAAGVEKKEAEEKATKEAEEEKAKKEAEEEKAKEEKEKEETAKEVVVVPVVSEQPEQPEQPKQPEQPEQPEQSVQSVQAEGSGSGGPFFALEALQVASPSDLPPGVGESCREVRQRESLTI
jgi:hypothetical protein